MIVLFFQQLSCGSANEIYKIHTSFHYELTGLFCMYNTVCSYV